MQIIEDIVVSGWGFEVPSYGPGDQLTGLLASDPAGAEFDPKSLLGRKGLRFKDRATQLALCAALKALRHANLPETRDEQIAPDLFGAVVSSNFGNVDTVCSVLDVIREQGASKASAMALPNASSNIVASTLAIRFGLKGMNLFVSNGSTSGLDAIQVAANAIRTGRATRMLVVGVEPANEYTQQLAQMVNLSAFDGAAALVIESKDAALARSHKPHGRLGSYDFSPNTEYVSTRAPALSPIMVDPHSPRGCKPMNHAYGAWGQLGVILAMESLTSQPRDHFVAASGKAWGDSVSTGLFIHPPEEGTSC